MLTEEAAPTIHRPTDRAAMADNDAATPRKTLAYLDDAVDDADEDHDDDADSGAVVSALTVRQCPRASQYEPPARPQPSQQLRPSSILRLPTRALRGPTIYGWLWKKGASFKTWKKRFFLLNGATLTYYTQACVVSTEVGTRCLELPATGGLRVAGAEMSELTQFGLCVSSSSGRVLYLQAGDRAARIKWLGVLQEAAKKSSLDGMIRATRVSDAFKATPSGTATSTGSGGRDGGCFADTASSDASRPSSSMSSKLSSEGRDADGGYDGDEDDEDEDADRGGPTDMQGWLHVRRRTPSVLNLYKKRFVTLLDGHLTLARDVRGRRPVEKSLEVIAASPWHGHEHGLRLQLEKHKELYVYASSSDEAKRWLRAVHNNL